jgi:phosphonate transport system substrate-binding protein
MHRRTFLGLGLAWATLAGAADGGADKMPLRIGLTPVFLDDQAGFIDRWRAYLAERTSRSIDFVQRGSYREIGELLHQGKLDVAWVCGYPYVRSHQFMRLLAVPEFAHRPTYHSYLIVPKADTTTKSILDLRGKVFAFSDPDSNSGYLYPNYHLISLLERPNSFFGKTFFTWAHRKVVEAVAARVASGGAVDGYIWETLARFHPELTSQTRVVERSPEFGFPPFVARASLSPAVATEFRRVLVAMREDKEGRALLDALNLTGFVAGEERLFDAIDHMSRVLAKYSNESAA